VGFNPKDAVDAARDIATNAVEKASDIVENASDMIRGDIAGGASGIVQGSGRELAEGLFEGGKVRSDWSSEAATLPAEWQRLACNMLVIAAEVLPRGGTASVRVLGAGASGIDVTAEGESVNIPAELRVALEPAVSVDQLTSRTVHAYFTRRLATQLGANLTLAEASGARAIFRAAA